VGKITLIDKLVVLGLHVLLLISQWETLPLSLYQGVGCKDHSQ